MRLARFAIPLALALTAACGGDSNPTGPGTNLPNGTFAMQVDGSAFSAISAIVLVSGNITSIGVGSANGTAMGMAWVEAGTGTYTIGSSVGANANYNVSGGGGWTAGSGQGSGTITITARTATRVAGSFSLQLQPLASTGATGTKTLTGSFDLTY